LTNAIDQGGDLGDILRSAAYDYVKAINKENIGSLFDSVLNLGKAGVTSLFASGGRVTGGSGSKDDVPAMLMGGEYVINKRAVQKYGPQFFDSINSGQMSGFAAGGKVPKQTGPQGNFYTPGTYGTGGIEGKKNLLDFATQSGTSGKFDQMINTEGYQSIALESESSRLSMMGMRNSPAFEATQSAKQESFDLYLQQYNQEQEIKKAKEEQKKAFTRQLLMAGITAVGGMALEGALNGIGNAFSSGAKANIANASAKAAAKGTTLSSWGKAWAGLSGGFKGGMIDGKNVGGLGNLFSGVGSMATGNFKGGLNQIKLSQIGTQEQYFKAIENPNFAGYLGVAPRASIVSAAPPRFNNVIYGNTLKPPYINAGTSNRQGTLMDYYNQLKRATGGMIPQTSGVDTVPAMLSGGEFIMNRAAVQNIGSANLQSMNSGATSSKSDDVSKDLNDKLIAKLDELIEATGSSGDININVSSSDNRSQEASQEDDASSKQQMARQIRDAVLKIIQEEKRIGGSLRR
jgi:hypothetical protein